MKARRRLAPEDRRRELLDAALAVLAERGVDARVDDVVRAAGAAKGTFYLYYPSWNDLLAAARDRLMDEYRAGMAERRAHATGDWWAMFLAELEHFVDHLLAMGPLHEALFHGPLAAPTRGESAPPLIAAVLREGIAAEVVATDDPDTAAVLVFELVHGTADAIKRGGDRDRTVAELRRLLREGLGTA